MLLLEVAPGQAAEGRLIEFLGRVQPGELVPGADHFGPVQGTPPTAPAYQGDRLLGHAYLNADWVNSTGYSGKPIAILVGIGRDGAITGARLVEHHEPIVLVGIPVDRINRFIQGYVGLKPQDLAVQTADRPPVDIVSGATVTVMVIGDSLLRSAAKVARALALGDAAAAPVPPASRRTIDLSQPGSADWATLLGDGSIRRLTLSVADINAAFARTGNPAVIDRPEPGPDDDAFINLYVAPVSVPVIGRSLLGTAGYAELAARLHPGQQAVVIAGAGRYSFKGSGYVRGGIFDRIDLVQDETTVRFHDRNHQRLRDLAAAGAPDFKEIGLFVLPEGGEFDPTRPWRLQLLVQRAIGALDKAFLTVDLAYTLPDRYQVIERPVVTAAATDSSGQPAAAAAIADRADPAPAPAETPLWQRLWTARTGEIAVLAVALALLTGIFFFQDLLVVRPRLYSRLRLGYLLFTLVALGWVGHAQISVVNILTFTNALRSDFRWDYFLMDPLVFILWFAVAASLLFWGRGAFCGWLCPFGALQELTNRAARRLGVRQITVPFGLHQRLWPIKYMLFLLLFGLSLYSLALSEQAAEVEPFKTAIVLHFLRDWPFVLFAVALLLAGLFVERFFCRYLCPLGAALALPARLRMFDWLRRYRECGSPCQRCANECPVQAIHPEGQINPNECIQCLHCQVLYHHDQKCPVMIQKRLKREKRAALSSTDMTPTGQGHHTRVQATADGGLTARPG